VRAGQAVDFQGPFHRIHEPSVAHARLTMDGHLLLAIETLLLAIETRRAGEKDFTNSVRSQGQEGWVRGRGRPHSTLRILGR
jgi:hypothetical protein